MRNCKFIFFAVILSLLFSACLKHHSSASLSVSNESGKDLWIESFIVSDYCDSTKSFLLRDGNTQLIAISKQSKVENYSDLSLESCVFNNDAHVRVYTIDSLGMRSLIQTWYFANRHNDGRELFNETNNEKSTHSNAAGDVVVSYLFTFLPEDIAGTTKNMKNN